MNQTTLYYRQGASDKVYQAEILPKDGGHIVAFAYGRRGSTLTAGVKTPHPVDLDTARSIHAKLVREKTAKGYVPGEESASTLPPETADTDTGIHCQLLTPIEDNELDGLLSNPAVTMQEKFDGRRLLIHKQGLVVTGINRLGRAVGLPAALATSAGLFPADCIIDGEAIGDVLHAFDMLAWDAQDLRGQSYRERYLVLFNALARVQQRQIRLVETATKSEDKSRLYARVKAAQGEGVVFKEWDAVHKAGRPNSGGPQRKHKFVESASAIVMVVNAKRSVALGLYDGTRMVPAGNVTIPPNHPVPEVGEVVEVRYLYAMPESGALFQPVYLGVREDVEPGDCLTAQLKYRRSMA